MSKKPSLVSGARDTPLLELTVGQLLAQAVEAAPEREALVSCHQNIRMTYRDLDEASDRFARGLVSLGLEPGDRIGIWSPNNIEWIVTLYAAAKLGLILVNVNPAYRPIELEFALNKAGCKALVMADRFKTSNYPEMIRKLAPEVDSCEKGRLRSASLPALEVLVLIGDEARDGFILFDEVELLGPESEIDIAMYEDACDIHSPVNIQFTSGTTGQPKGATLTHHNIVNNAFFVGRGIRLSQKDRLCLPVPLYHCFGMVMGVLACAAHRATLVLPGDFFDPLGTLETIAKEACTALYGVPTMFSAILDLPEFGNFKTDTLRTGIVAGALCPRTLMQRILDDLHMGEVTNCYGMTETSPVSFQTDVNESLEKRTTTVGRVHPHIEAKIVGPEGDILPRGEPGEICTRGYCVMQGYWGDEEKTKASIVDGWMLTGDEGVLDDDGYCAIVGRIKDLIIRGGENIAPAEIEEYLSTHDDILEAQAFGVPDEKFGEIVCVWIRKAPGSDLDEDGVRDYCRDRIAHFKVPAIVRFVEEFPLTVTGKVQKFVMRDRMIEELGLVSD